MSYTLKLSTNEIPKIDPFPTVPDWVIKRIPKGKKVTISYHGGVWMISCKKIGRFDKKLVASAIELAAKVRQGGE